MNPTDTSLRSKARTTETHHPKQLTSRVAPNSDATLLTCIPINLLSPEGDYSECGPALSGGQGRHLISICQINERRSAFFKTINFHNAHRPAGLLVKNLTAIAKPGINQRSECSCYSRRPVGLQVIRLTGEGGSSP